MLAAPLAFPPISGVHFLGAGLGQEWGTHRVFPIFAPIIRGANSTCANLPQLAPPFPFNDLQKTNFAPTCPTAV